MVIEGHRYILWSIFLDRLSPFLYIQPIPRQVLITSEFGPEYKVWEIGKPGGIDVSQVYPDAGYGQEFEVTYQGTIESRYLRGYYDVVKNPAGQGALGDFHPTPDFNP